MEYDNMVIAFAGCARSGKTTSAQFTQEYITNVLNEQSELMSFAGPLKTGLNIMGVDKEKDYDLYRELAQQVGTNYLRNYKNDWWVDLMRENISKYFEKMNTNGLRGIVIIDDVRFPNESSMVNSMDNGVNVFVYGGSKRINLELDVYKHASESLGVYFEKISRGMEIEYNGGSMDHIVGNQENLKSLYMNIDSLCENIFIGKLNKTT